jgi:predicted dehydrogenase
MEGKEGVIVIGYGRIGQVHLASVLAHPKLFLHTLVGKDEARCKTALGNALKPHLNREGKLKDGAMPHAFSSDKFKELIEKNDPVFENARYVVIASPTPNHAELIELALKYKKPFHILCEKPLTTDPATNQVLYEKAQKAGVALITGKYFKIF